MTWKLPDELIWETGEYSGDWMPGRNELQDWLKGGTWMSQFAEDFCYGWCRVDHVCEEEFIRYLAREAEAAGMDLEALAVTRLDKVFFRFRDPSNTGLPRAKRAALESWEADGEVLHEVAGCERENGYTLAVIVKPRAPKKMTLDFSKPLPAHDEETGEYAGFWWVDGEKIEAPEDASGAEIEALRMNSRSRTAGAPETR